MRTIIGILGFLVTLSASPALGQKSSYPWFDFAVARRHAIKPHRLQIPVDGLDQAWPSLHTLRLTLTISPIGDVAHAEATGVDDDERFWPQVESEVYRWKFTPFEVGGKAVMAKVEEHIDLVPPERLPKRHIPPPAITKDSNVAITLQRWGCDGAICPPHTVTIRNDQIVFKGFGEVVAQGRHTDKIDKDAVLALAKRFAAADFYSMDDDYYGTENIPFLLLSITIDGRAKTVRSGDGPWVGMPSVILELEDEVDTVARTKRWIEGGDGLVAALRTERFDFRSYYAQRILERAAAYGQTVTVRELLAAGVPVKPMPAPESSDPEVTYKEVQLLTAASMHPDTLQVFLDSGVSKDDQKDKDLALDLAAEARSLEAVRALIAYGANPDTDLSKLREYPGSVLIDAVRSGNPEVVKEILRYGPKLETRESGGKTALFVAAESRSDRGGDPMECVRLLTKAGASIDARDTVGNTPLHVGYLLEVDEELLRLGADVDARNHDGETPIFTNVNNESFALFLKHGADLTIRNNRGDSAIEAAGRWGLDREEALRKAILESTPQ